MLQTLPSLDTVGMEGLDTVCYQVTDLIHSLAISTIREPPDLTDIYISCMAYNYIEIKLRHKSTQVTDSC